MILVTGSTGFVGKSVLKVLPHGLCRSVIRKDGMQGNIANSFVIDEMCSTTNWEGAFSGIDTIIHLAGLAHKNIYSYDDYVEVNCNGTLHLASEAIEAGVKRFVFVSTIGVNGSCSSGKPFNELDETRAHNHYTESKYLAEKGLIKLAKETGLEVVIVRPTLVYGVNAPGNFNVLIQLINKLPFMPFGLCKNKRSFISVGNLADFLYTCAIHPKAAGEVFVICDGKAVSTKTFTDAISSGLGKSIIQLPIPVKIMYFAAILFGRSKQAKQLLGDLDVDATKARSLLEWEAPETMEQAMAQLRIN
jgi:nucleoside-diphosphate-sugar epimerase